MTNEYPGVNIFGRWYDTLRLGKNRNPSEPIQKPSAIVSMGTSECRDPNAANGWLTHLMEMRSRGNPAKGRHCGACG
jgi:hypothetical protein